MTPGWLVPALVGLAAWWVLGSGRGSDAPPTGTPAARRLARARAGGRGEWIDAIVSLGRLVPGPPAGSASGRDATRLVREAGAPLGLDPARWLALERGAFFLGSATAGLLAVPVILLRRDAWAAPLVALAAGSLLRPWLVTRGRQRAAALDRHLPDLADRVALSLDAGRCLPDAVRDAVAAARLSPGVPPWLVRELAAWARDLWLGDTTLADSLDRLCARVAAPRLPALRAQLALAARAGGPLAEVLRAFARVCREDAEARATGRLGEFALRVGWVGIVPVLGFIGVAVVYVRDLMDVAAWGAR